MSWTNVLIFLRMFVLCLTPKYFHDMSLPTWTNLSPTNPRGRWRSFPPTADSTRLWIENIVWQGWLVAEDDVVTGGWMVVTGEREEVGEGVHGGGRRGRDIEWAVVDEDGEVDEVVGGSCVKWDGSVGGISPGIRNPRGPEVIGVLPGVCVLFAFGIQ